VDGEAVVLELTALDDVGAKPLSHINRLHGAKPKPPARIGPLRPRHLAAGEPGTPLATGVTAATGTGHVRSKSTSYAGQTAAWSHFRRTSVTLT
jgi:hypothetical protein